MDVFAKLFQIKKHKNIIMLDFIISKAIKP